MFVEVSVLSGGKPSVINGKASFELVPSPVKNHMNIRIKILDISYYFGDRMSNGT